MTRAAHTTAEPTQPDPQQDRPVFLIPGRLGAMLLLVRTLLGYGRRLAETAPARARHPQFTTVASAFGTFNLQTILARVERGILRAIALEHYLIERAAKGRDIAIVKRHIFGHPVGFTDPPESDDAEQPANTGAPEQPAGTGDDQAASAKPQRTRPAPQVRSFPDPDHPSNFHIYTMEELEAQVRSRPIGRTIIEICNDLGIIPSFCDGGFWSDIFNAIWWYGGSFAVMFEARKRREKAFEQERNHRPDAWDWDWRDTRPERVRRVLGCLIGELPNEPATDPPPH